MEPRTHRHCDRPCLYALCCCCGPAGAKVPYKVVDRRPGDTVAVWAATEYAEQELGWKAKLGLTEMCRDQWAWAKKYPKVGVCVGVKGFTLGQLAAGGCSGSTCRWVGGWVCRHLEYLCLCAWAGGWAGGMGL